MKRHSYWWLWLAEFPCPVSCPQPHSYLLLNPMHQRPISELLRVITLYTSDLIPGAQPKMSPGWIGEARVIFPSRCGRPRGWYSLEI